MFLMCLLSGILRFIERPCEVCDCTGYLDTKQDDVKMTNDLVAKATDTDLPF